MTDAREKLARLAFQPIADRMGWHHRFDDHPSENTLTAYRCADAILSAFGVQGGEA